MRIALDLMGGDNAPAEMVKGAFEFLQSADESVSLILVGQEAVLMAEVANYPFDESRVRLLAAQQVVGMDEKPAKILKTKPDSSIVRAVQLVRDHEADGVVSAGNTGALLTSARLLLHRIPGVRRPAIATFIPSAKGGFLLCDAGANVDVRAADLVQFAIMARAYAIHEMHIKRPRIGLLNIGAEPGKGNELTIRAYAQMSEHVDGFIGNVESRDLFADATDVVVCDGFVGNVLLKLSEGMIINLSQWVKYELMQHPISLVSLPLLRPALKKLRQDLDWEEHGGSPLLGVNGVAIVGHGSSNAKAIKNALRATQESVQNNLIVAIRDGIAKHKEITEEHHAITT